MSEHKNTILAIVLSGAVLLLWQYFFGLPQMEKQRQEALQRQQQQTQQQTQPSPAQPAQPGPGGVPAPGTASTPGTASAPGAAPAPGTAPAPSGPQSVAAALAAGERVAITTPDIKGSISLRGGAHR